MQFTSNPCKIREGYTTSGGMVVVGEGEEGLVWVRAIVRACVREREGGTVSRLGDR